MTTRHRAGASTAPPETCWVCGSTTTALWKGRSIARELTPEDLRITDSRYGTTLGLRRCADCGFVFAEGAEVEHLTALYERLSDPGYEDTQEPRALQMRWLLRTALHAHPAARSLLDVGAGTGLLVAEAARTGLRAVGVEPSRALVHSGMNAYNISMVDGVFPHPDLEGERFDLVFLVDVIEHVAEPLRLLRACADALGEGGVLVVVTPDRGSLAARALGRRWWHLRLAHVGYFDRSSLARAVDACGLVAVRETRARWFFRVAYLAERAARYLPLRRLNRLARRLGPLRWLYDRVIPLNLHDSFVVLLRRRDQSWCT